MPLTSPSQNRGPLCNCVFGTVLAGALLLMPAPVGQAADDYAVGDSIEVHFLGEWRPAVVLATSKRGEVQAEYEFGASSQRRVFKPNEVRYEWESGAIARGRIWSDTTGSFRQKAALVSINEDDSVTIRKPDLTELKIPLKSLSAGDQKYVRTIKKEAGPKAVAGPQPAPLEEFEGALGSFSVSFSGNASDQTALSLDPTPAYLKLKQGGTGFATEDFFDKLGAVLPLGGPDSWVLAAIENGTPGGALPSRILWVSLAKQKVEGRQLLPPGEVILDYHPPTRRLLTFNTVEAEGAGSWGKATLSLWEASPTDKDQPAKPIVRWNADPGEHRWHDPWARIIDGNVVVQRMTKQEYVGWDTSAKKAIYKIPQESFFAPAAVLSGGRKFLFLPEDKGVRTFEAATGKAVSNFPAKNGASGVALSEDGQRLAVLEDYELAVWDVTNPQSGPERYQAQAIGTPFTADLAWIGNERIMADKGAFGQVLFSLKSKIALWNYHFDHSAVREDAGRRLREVIDGHLVYAASIRDGRQSGLAVGAVKLPGPKVDEIEAATDPESLLIMKAGSEVKLDIRTGTNDAKVRAALEAEVNKNGWVLSDSASAVLIAEMKQGESQTVTYSSTGFGGGGQQSATITPFISSLQLKIGDTIAWSSGTSTGAPPFVRLEQGQSLQGEVSKWQKPDPDFYGRVDIPDRIMDPKKKDGLGTTDVTTRGLIPK
jgi:hypothetical protein